MKKFILLLLFFLALSSMMMKTYAYEHSIHHIEHNNLLSLSNFTIHYDEITSSHKGQTIIPIPIKPNVTYTLVASFGFLGQYSDYLDYYQIRVQHVNQGNFTNHDFVERYQDQLAYIEFSSPSDLIHIRNFPATPSTHEIVLFEGFFSEFESFKPFLNENVKLDEYGELIMDYDHLLTLDTIKSAFSAKNLYHQTLDLNILNDSFSIGDKKPGLYHITFMASFGQIDKRFHLSIRIIDTTPPVINYPSGVMVIPLAQKISVEEIKQRLNVSDNVDLLNNSDLEVVSDTYTHTNSLGHCSIRFKATDSSGNQSFYDLQINLVDNEPPLIIGPVSLFIYTEDTPLDDAQIISRFVIFDDVDDENIEVRLSRNDYNKTQIPGNYLVVIEAKDQQNNIAYHEFYIHVVNNTPPYFEVDPLILDVDFGVMMSETEIIQWFITTMKSRKIEVKQVKVVYNEYSNKHNQTGEYFVYLNYDYNNETLMTRIKINVAEDESKTFFKPIMLVFIPAVLAVGVIAFKKIRK